VAAEIELLAGGRQSGETDAAAIACNDWLRMGPGRSLSALVQKYSEGYQRHPPTQSLGTLKKWSRRFGWVVRAVEFDATWEQRKTEERNAELNHGLSLDYERIRKLKRLSDFLEAQIYELSPPDPATGRQSYYNVWVPDVKVVGTGDNAEVVDIERFNAALFTQYRETLNDLAKEVGGRVQKQEVSGPDGGALQVRVTGLEDLSDDELDTLLEA
jgi:hypothetical protein